MKNQTAKVRTEKQVAKDVATDKAEMDKQNAQAHEALAFGIAALIASDPRIEWQIVQAYCKRENKYLVDCKQYDHEYLVALMADEKVTAQPA